jgi:hypothetical protein
MDIRSPGQVRPKQGNSCFSLCLEAFSSPFHLHISPRPPSTHPSCYGRPTLAVVSSVVEPFLYYFSPSSYNKFPSLSGSEASVKLLTARGGSEGAAGLG